MAVRRSPKPLVGVRFPPPEPTFYLSRSSTMKFLRLAIPVSVFFLSILNFGVSVAQHNDMAIWANLTAMFGWLLISADEFFNYKTSQINGGA